MAPRLFFALLAALPLCAAAEFRSVGENATILYDAPSTRGTKLFVVGRDLPVEIISTDGTWTKVRDSAGTLAWVERKALADKRMLIVTVPYASVHERADDKSPVLFQVQQGVLLDLTGSAGGWAQVKHADGSGGYVRINQVWGL